MGAEAEKRIRLDVWGGPGSMDHLAREHFEVAGPDWAARTEVELRAGYLVNLRLVGPGEGWGPDQSFDERVPELLATPAAVRFVSYEPALGPVDFRPWLFIYTHEDERVLDAPWLAAELPFHDPRTTPADEVSQPRLDWVICGGENGPRPMHRDWARRVRDDCADAGVPFFFKQWGEACPPRPGLVPVPDDRIGWISRAGDTIFNPTDAEFQRMTRDDDRLGDGSAWWSLIVRVGKAAAGRLLDGVTHDALPNTTTTEGTSR